MFWNKKIEEITPFPKGRGMVTIHIFEKWSQRKHYKFIREMYGKFLRKDDLFHFFYEPDLIIRAKNRIVIGEIEKYLTDHHILHEIYSYPEVKKDYQYGDPQKSMTVRYMKEFLEAYHAIAVFILTAKTKDLPEIRAKLIHGLYNMDFKSYEYEGRALNNLGMNRMYQIGQMEGMKYKEKSKKLEYIKSKRKNT